MKSTAQGVYRTNVVTTYRGEHFVVHGIIKSLCSTPETNNNIVCQLHLKKKKGKKKI